MLKIVLCVVLALSCSLAYDNSDDFINEINSKQSLWKAGRNFHKDMPKSQIRGMLGMKTLSPEILSTIPVKTHELTDEIPESFDSRTQWSSCKTIKEVADQSTCGSCWAVATASAISDRICIHSEGKLQPEISAKNLMSCTMLSSGCNGGYPFFAFLHWQTSGLVTGGAYNSNVGCQPYPFAPCEHHIDGSKPACSAKLSPTPRCVHECDNSDISYSKDLIHGKEAYRIARSEKQIQAEIMKNGPVVAGFEVFSDFMHYKSGVYSRTGGDLEGRHAVRVIGWGVENNTKYWLVMNSWNEDWGDKGLFKILRGKNECGFEAEISAGLPK